MQTAAAFDLFTVGHSNHPPERFLALLQGAGISAVADVRSRPFSRRFPWFSRERLAARLKDAGIAYVGCGDSLGGRPEDAALLRDGVADYEAMAATPAFRAGIAQVTALCRKHRLCLMCAEKEPLDCHRCLLVTRALAAEGLAVGHILADGTIEPHAATEERLLAATRVHADLFSPERSAALAEAYRRRAAAVAFRA